MAEIIDGVQILRKCLHRANAKKFLSFLQVCVWRRGYFIALFQACTQVSTSIYVPSICFRVSKFHFNNCMIYRYFISFHGILYNYGLFTQ